MGVLVLVVLPTPTMNTPVLLCTVLMCTVYVSSTPVLDVMLDTIQRMAFRVCDSDRMEGLTWKEVSMCEERFSNLLTSQNIAIPSEADFRSADLNGDGRLVYGEWKQWVGKVK